MSQGKVEEKPDEFDADLKGHEETRDDRILAYDIKELHGRLSQLRDDQLRQIPILANGTPLHQGDTYIDLNDLSAGEFLAAGSREAEAGHYYVSKKELDYEFWNLLTGKADR